MRYLKLFESLDDNLVIDKDYIEMCFVNFIDNDNFKLVFHAGNKTCEINIDVEDTSYRWKEASIEEFIKRSKGRNDFFNEIKEILSKINIEYPGIYYKVYDRSNADEQEIRIYLSVSEKYVSHNPTGWFNL